MPTSHLLKVHSRGVDSAQIQKLASNDVIMMDLSTIQPHKGKSFVHLISMGAGEFYGSNNNADYFNEKSASVEIPEHFSDGKPRTITLSEGLTKYHSTFMKYGAVYKEHFNSKKGGVPLGDVVAEWYNPAMHRGELVVGLDNARWSPTLQKLARGESVFWSMGCYVAGTLVIMADGTWKAIEDVMPDDVVVTHTGAQVSVESSRVLTKTTSLYTIKAASCLPLVCTDNHEQYVVRRETALDDKGYFRNDLDIPKEASWVRTDDLRLGDWMLSPLPKLGTESVDRNYAYLAGWYVAEGDLRYDVRTNSYRTRFNTGWNDPLYTEIDDICNSIGTTNKPLVYPDPLENRRSIYVTDKSLYDSLLGYGRGSHNKCLAPEVFTWDEASVLSFLAGYLSGDGCFYEDKVKENKKNLFGSTASKQLALQVQRLCLALGGIVSVHKIKHTTSKSATMDLGYPIEYQMRFDAFLTAKLAPLVFKVSTAPRVTNHGSSTRRIHDEYAMYKISKLEVHEEDKVDVYNFHVASDDHSYLVNGLATHNCGVPYDLCSICGNEAPTRAQYCDHMKYNKLSLTKEGNQVFCYNDQPHLHDISQVAVPAFRVAFALSKVASGGIMEEGEPDARNMWLPLSVITNIGTRLEQKHAEAFHKAAEIEKEILAKGMSPEESNLSEAFEAGGLDDETVKELQQYPLGDILSAFNRRKIMLDPKSFVKIVVGKPESDINGLQGLPCAVKKVFSELADSGDSEVFSDSSYTPLEPRQWTGLEELGDKIAEEFSIEDEPIRRRIVKVAISGGPSLSKRASLLVAPTASAESEYLAREYAKYQIVMLAGAGVDKYAHRIIVHNQVQTT